MDSLLAHILFPSFDYHVTVIASNLNAKAFVRQFFRCNQARTAAEEGIQHYLTAPA